MLILPLGGDAATPPGLVRLWSVPVAAENPLQLHMADAERSYWALPDGEDQWVLTARRLDDGGVVWRSRIRTSTGRPVLAMAGGIPAAWNMDGTVRGYDPDTGEERWRAPGWGMSSVGERIVLWQEPGNRPGEADVGARRLTLLDPQTGKVGPSEVVPPGAVALAPGREVRLWHLARDGTLRRSELSAGAEPLTVSTPHVERMEHVIQNHLRVSHGQLLLTARGGEGPLVAAYDPGTLQQRWTAPRATSGGECGDLLCLWVHGPDSGDRRVLQAVNPASGEVRWSHECGQPALTDCRNIWVTEVGAGDWLWVREPPNDESHRGRALNRGWPMDPATGAPLAASVPWEPRRVADGGRVLLSQLREDTSLAEPGAAHWWAYADAGPFEPRVLGKIQADSCRLHRSVLLCVTRGDDGATVTAWRLPL